MIKRISFFFFASLLLAVFWPSGNASAAGASLYFSPSASTQSVGSRFTVSVKMNTGGQSINAAQGTISFDKAALKVVSVSKNGSIFAFWTDEPSFSNSAGTVDFGGGIPRPGYEGNGGSVFSVVFEALRTGVAEVSFVSGSVLANDGKGTNVLTAMGGASFSINPAVISPDAPKSQADQIKAGNAEKASLLEAIVSSETNPDPDKWYRDRQVKFSWKLPEGAEGVSVSFDKNPTGDPGDASDGLFDSKEFIAESDGVWYLHIKVRNKDGWGTVVHRPVKVDTTPPEPFEAWTKQEDPNDWPTVFFKTIDKLSGLIRYALVFNSLKSEPYVVSPDKDSLKISDFETGEHTAMIRAVDEAGNETVSTISFEIRPILEPKIDNYSAELSADDKFFVSGTSIPDAIVKIFIRKDGLEKEDSYSVSSDKDGSWSFILPSELPNGRYVFWAEAINANGLASRPSSIASFLVTPPVFARFGSFVINYFTVFVSLLFMLVLIIFLSVLIARLLRNRLKKETIEIEEVLEKNLEILRSSLAGEASALARLSRDRAGKSGVKGDISKEIIGLKQRLEERIVDTGRKIMKEVKDVEKILK
jgi:hypothetical protein